MKQRYDYIITGAGPAGLMCAWRMCQDPHYADKSILIIDSQRRVDNDRTWSYWSKEEDPWEDIRLQSWRDIVFKGPGIDKQIDCSPYRYNMLKSAPFYEKMWATIDAADHVAFALEEVQAVNDKRTHTEVQTRKSTYHGDRVINSILLSRPHEEQQVYPVLQQHFLGWFIRTAEPVFNTEAATFMDFTVEQRGNTRFMYVLPESEREALLEYTLFSEQLLDKSEYEEAIREYISGLGITDYTIVDTEGGSIPMTCYPFEQHNSERLIHIGTAGGWTKGSTGYTFMNCTRKSATLIDFLKTNKPLNTFQKRKFGWYQDLLLLDILHQDNSTGAALFSSLFKKAKVQDIFAFLDEEASLATQLRVMMRMPWFPFFKVLMTRLNPFKF